MDNAMDQGVRASLGERIAKTLKERILNLEYLPNHRLTEEEISLEFQVSRSPVREALRILSAGGLVKSFPNRGVRVREVDVREIEQLYGVRMALEQYSVEALEAGAFPPAMLDELHREWSEVLAGRAGDAAALAARDRAFHVALARAGGNAVLVEYLEAINERLAVFRLMDFSSPERVEVSARQHLAILDALKRGDADAARAAMRGNVADSKAYIRKTVVEALGRAAMGEHAQKYG